MCGSTVRTIRFEIQNAKHAIGKGLLHSADLMGPTSCPLATATVLLLLLQQQDNQEKLSMAAIVCLQQLPRVE